MWLLLGEGLGGFLGVFLLASGVVMFRCIMWLPSEGLFALSVLSVEGSGAVGAPRVVQPAQREARGHTGRLTPPDIWLELVRPEPGPEPPTQFPVECAFVQCSAGSLS